MIPDVQSSLPAPELMPDRVFALPELRYPVKLNVGEFEEGLVEGESGNIHILHVEEMILAVFAKSDVKMGLLEKSIRDFAGTIIQRK